jgi:putative transposase
LQGLIEDELPSTIGAVCTKRTYTRTAQRNGGRGRVVSPAVDAKLRTPKLTAGSFRRSLLEPRRRVDRALCAVIMSAFRNRDLAAEGR